MNIINEYSRGARNPLCFFILIENGITRIIMTIVWFIHNGPHGKKIMDQKRDLYCLVCYENVLILV